LSLVLASCAPAAAPAPDPVTVSVVETQIVEREVVVTVVVEGESREVIITATPAPTAEARPVKKVASNVQYVAVMVYREGNEIKGYEYELYKEALNRAGYDVEVVDVAFAGIFAGLQAEKWDLACSNIFITIERENEMDFTEPFFEGFDFLVALEDGPVKTLEDIRGKTLGTETGTSQAAYLASLSAEYGPFQTNLYEDSETQWGDLMNGRIAALSTGGTAFALRLRANPIFVKVAESQDNFKVGCAMRTGDPFKEEFDTALRSMKEDGTTAALFEKYFLFPAPEDSAATTIFTEPHVPTR
jgi:ABC-type amino acid transport substrate-binding protein